MSSYEPCRRRSFLGGAALLIAAATLSACQVTPLHSQASSPTGDGALPAIAIDPAGEPLAQDVRNNLIFLLNGGRGEPPAPAYRLELTVAKAVVPILRDAAIAGPRGRTVTLTASYTLRRTEDGEPVAARSQTATSIYDDFDQGFATVRAERDADRRAARELAERIRADLALVLRAGAGFGAAQGS